MVYQWSVPVYPVDAQTAGNVLERIAEKRGSLKPTYVVEESKDADSALHGCFEWDDKRAAEKYRQRQAQDLIRNLVAVKVGSVEAPQPVRAFVSIRQDHEYVPMTQVLQTPTLRIDMLAAAMKELESFRCKYAAIEALAELMCSIDQSIQDYKEMAVPN